MGVYIKGMEMPASCYACAFFVQSNYWGKEDEVDILSYCKRTGVKTWESVTGYLPNCPLVPVPPHGRLIDADEFLKRAIGTKCFRGDYALMLEELSGESTTILPAEEGE